MDTNNLDKWWYGLPENTRQAIGNDEIWEKLDMPSRSALHRYSLLRIYGTAKDRDEERTLLNEIACGLGDLALVRKNGIALEEMCNGNGEFYDEYQEQFDILYDNYGHIYRKYKLAGLDRTYNSDKQGTDPVIGTSRLQAYGNRYRQKNPENFLCFPSWVAHQCKRGLVLPHHTATGQFRTGAFCGMRYQRR